MSKELFVSVFYMPMVAPDCCVAKFREQGILDGVIGESGWPDDTCVIVNTPNMEIPEIAEMVAKIRAYHARILEDQHV